MIVFDGDILTPNDKEGVGMDLLEIECPDCEGRGDLKGEPCFCYGLGTIPTQEGLHLLEFVAKYLGFENVLEKYENLYP